ncbi:MAG: hypothetical protein RL308_3509 [Bacteroidota bacterium]|jgi:hypothetical protein
MKTALEWLIDKHFGGIENCTPDFKNHIEQAIEMEKKQQAGFAEWLARNHYVLYNESIEGVHFWKNENSKGTTNQLLKIYKNETKR